MPETSSATGSLPIEICFFLSEYVYGFLPMVKGILSKKTVKDLQPSSTRKLCKHRAFTIFLDIVRIWDVSPTFGSELV